MTSAPTVSVITISFNDLDGLQRTVKSVRAQRYRGRIEHIVIDGGSGDDVVAYLSGCEPGFAYWQSEPDGGRYDAMNQGIAHASGDLLWFLHSADRFSGPDVVAQAVEALSGKGPVSELWGFGMDRLVGLDRVRGPIPFSLRKFLAGKQVVPHQASFFGSSLASWCWDIRPTRSPWRPPPRGRRLREFGRGAEHRQRRGPGPAVLRAALWTAGSQRGSRYHATRFHHGDMGTVLVVGHVRSNHRLLRAQTRSPT